MGGLLIDTLAYNFLKSTSDYDSKSYLYYDEMVRDFFKYLANEPDKDHYQHGLHRSNQTYVSCLNTHLKFLLINQYCTCPYCVPTSKSAKFTLKMCLAMSTIKPSIISTKSIILTAIGSIIFVPSVPAI